MKLADYSQSVTVNELDAALRAGGFDGVFHYIAGTAGFALRIEDPAVVRGIRALGWPQLGIDIPRDPVNVDGAATAARVALVYGYPPGARIYLDIEPSQFKLDPAGWTAAADRWCDAVRAAGFSPGVYGTDSTTAACANHADSIWRATPGQCDPAGPGLADAFFAGRRIAQCSSGVWAGIEFDVSYSQFTVGGDMTPEEHTWLEDLWNGWFTQQNELLALQAGQTAAKAELDTLAAAVAALQAAGVPPAVLQPVLDSIAKLAAHLGEGTA